MFCKYVYTECVTDLGKQCIIIFKYLLTLLLTTFEWSVIKNWIMTKNQWARSKFNHVNNKIKCNMLSLSKSLTHSSNPSVSNL